MDMDRKGIAAISGVVTVLLTMALFSTAFYIFYQGDKKVQVSIQSTNIVESAYSRDAVVDFYVYSAGYSAVGDNCFKDTNKFLESFRQEIKKYKSGNLYLVKEFEQVELQLVNSNVVMNGNKILLTLNFKIEKENAIENVVITKVDLDSKKVYEFLMSCNN